jgi:hypothetical protein
MSFLLTGLMSLVPLYVSGLIPDFVTGILHNNSSSQGGAARVVSVLSGLVNQFDTFAYFVVPLAVFLVPTSDRRQGSTALVWLAAFLFVLLYKPIHPRNHVYLEIPLAVVFAVNAGVLTQLLLSAARIPATFRLLCVLLLLGVTCKTRPEFCVVRPSLWAASDAIRGKTREITPPGYRRGPVSTAAFYKWDDYRSLLDYLKRFPSKNTKIANALKGDPAVVGLLGRLPAFPTESISWLQYANPSDEARFANALEHEPDSLVIWAPGETGPDPAFQMDLLESAIRRLYEPGVRFGCIEVWRRKDASEPGGIAANQRLSAQRAGG